MMGHLKHQCAAAALSAFVLASPAADAAMIRYRVLPPKVDMSLSYEMQSDEWDRAGASRTQDKTTMREKFKISTRGWVYNPALMTFSAQVRPEFAQRRDDPGGDSNGVFLGFSIDTRILPYKPYSINLHASQDRSSYTGSLGQDRTTDASLYRGVLNLKKYWMPTTFTLERSERTVETFYTTYEERTLARVESQHRTQASNTTMKAEFEEGVGGRIGGGGASERLTLEADNRYFTSAKSTLNSKLRYTDVTTMTGRDRMSGSLTSHLGVRHYENLRTRYEVKLSERREPDYEAQTMSGMASLRHRLYENLTTSLDANFHQIESAAATDVRHDVAAGFDYTRPIPWGRVNVDLGYAERYRDFRRHLLMEPVFSEPHEFRDEAGGLIVELKNIDIAAESVVVTESGGIVEYQRGVDYDVAQIGRYTYLQWIGGFGAGDAVEVLVDYRYAQDPSVETTATSTRFGVSTDLWSRLQLYYRWSETEVNLLSGTAATEEDRTHTTHGFGALLRLRRGALSSTTSAGLAQTVVDASGGREAAETDTLSLRQQLDIGRWSRTTLEFEGITAAEGGEEARMEVLRLRQYFIVGNWSRTTLEAEDRTVTGDLEDSTFRAVRTWTPGRTLRATQAFTFRPTRRMSLGLGASYSRNERGDTGDWSEGFDYNAQLGWRLSGFGNLTASAYHGTLEGLVEDRERRGLEVRYDWRYGSWRPMFRYRFMEDIRQPVGETGRERTHRKNVLYFEARRGFR